MAQRTTEASVQPGKPVIGPGGFGENVAKDLQELFGLLGSLSALNISNGSFEISTDGITPDSCVISLYPGGSSGLVTDVPMHGTRGYEFIHPGGAGNGGGTLTFDYFPVDELVTQAIQGMYYASAAGMKLEVILLWYDKAKVALGGTPSTSLYSSTANPTSATKTVWQFTPPATARFMRLKLVGGNSDTDVAGTAYFDGFALVPVAVQNMLKTATSEISQFASGDSGGTASSWTSPTAGEYTFLPVTKIVESYPAGAGGSIICYPGWSASVAAAYAFHIFISATDANPAGAVAGVTGYAQFRYVTSSGSEHWIFLLVDPSGRIVSGASAPDHPSFGSGNDSEKHPHPWVGHVPDGHSVVCLSMDEIRRIKDLAQKNNRSLLEEIHSGGHVVDLSVEIPWEPRDMDGKRIMNIQHPSFTHRRLIK
ncbi:MAG: hypothetical protein AABZ15_01440 [Nitrospirota bacterium]